MKHHAPTGATKRSRRLRNNPTEAEKTMWRLLRANFLDARFRRQAPIRHYIVDFASHRAKLVVEVDGGQHNVDADAERDQIVKSEGYRILRFCNHDVLGNPDGVASVIADALPRPHPHPASPIEGEGKEGRP
jgi:very-short-patch-repair endonuclease